MQLLFLFLVNFLEIKSKNSPKDYIGIILCYAKNK